MNALLTMYCMAAVNRKNHVQALMTCTFASLDLIDWVQTHAAYWNMTQGENHFMASLFRFLHAVIIIPVPGRN